MSLRPKWQNIRRRNWEEIRDSWLAHVPNFPSVGAAPDPGLERLPTLLEIKLPRASDGAARLPDVVGVRRNALWEAVFLFHKSSHANLAAQRLGRQGMHSWCLFNAYHSAYLGAKGVMTLLGVALPNLAGRQVAIDLFPEQTNSKRTGRSLTSPLFQDFLIVGLPPQLDQRNLWEAFQRVLRMSNAACWDESLRQELIGLAHEAITPQRNHFLYQPQFWPLQDLIVDVTPEGLGDLLGKQLDEEDQGFLLRLCFSVYRLFEGLMIDFATLSAPIKEQVDASRCISGRQLPELQSYRDFLSQIGAPAGA